MKSRIIIIALLCSFCSLSCKSSNDVLAEYTFNKVKYNVIRKEFNNFCKALLKNIPDKKKLIKNFIDDYIYVSMLYKMGEKDNFFKNLLTEDMKNTLKEFLYINYYDDFRKKQYIADNKRYKFYKIHKLQFSYPYLKDYKKQSEYKKRIKDIDFIVLKIYNDIITNKNTYEEIVKIVSKKNIDSSVKSGYQALVELEDAYHWATFIVVNRKNNQIYINDSSIVSLYDKPENNNRIFLMMGKNNLFVQSSEEDKNKNGWLYVEFAPNHFGYIKEEQLKPLKRNNKIDISYPIKSENGWDIIKVYDSKFFNKKEYVQEMKDEYTDKSRLDIYEAYLKDNWYKIIGKIMREDLIKVYNSYLHNQNPVLPKDWKNKDILFKSDNLVIKKTEFANYLLVNSLISGSDDSNPAFDNMLFQSYVKMRIAIIKMEEDKFYDNQEYKELFKIREQIYLGEIFKNKKLNHSKVSISETELEEFYEQLKIKYYKTHKKDITLKKMPPLHEVKKELYNRILKDKQRIQDKKQKADLLQQVNIKYHL